LFAKSGDSISFTILVWSHIIKKKSIIKFGHLSTILNEDGLITMPAFCIALEYVFKVIVILCAVFLLLIVFCQLSYFQNVKN
jgi:hypothetical protein